MNIGIKRKIILIGLAAISAVLIVSLYLLISRMDISDNTDIDEEIQTYLDLGREQRNRRLFDEAFASFNQVLELDALHSEATFEVAETYFQAGQWVEAMAWFDAVRFVDPQRREAFSRRWASIINASAGDSLIKAAGNRAVRREVAWFLKKYPWDWETLNTARDGAILLQDSILTSEITERIIRNYPNSPAGYRIISENFYKGLNAICKDNPRRIEYLQKFLDSNKLTDFRETVWLCLLRSLDQYKDTVALKQLLTEWMAEEAGSPLPFERAVHYLIDTDIKPDSLLPLARIAIDNCRGWRGNPSKHITKRIMEGKILYANTRLNIARVLIDLRRYGEARLWLNDGLKYSGFDADDMETAAQFEYYLGVIAERDRQ